MKSTISVGDRIGRAMFVGLAVGLGWGIRGDFGHILGAMYPGACLGLGFAFVSGQRNAFKWMPLFGAVAGLGISLGGMMSYGILHGYAKSDTFVNYAYGFFTLFMQGGAWGIFGCAALGLLLERRTVSMIEWGTAIVTAIVGGFLFYLVVVRLLGFDVNPPRSNLSVGFTGGAWSLMAWLAITKRWSGLKGAMLGYIGFGLGMSMGRLLGNASYLQPFAINHWNVMETSCGLIGGFIFTFGMLGKRIPNPPEDRNFGLLSICSALYVLFLIPLCHRLIRIPADKKLEEWAGRLTGYGYANPDALAERVMMYLNIVVLVALAAAVIWLVIHFTNRTRLAAFPVLALSLCMVLIQNLNALYFWYDRQPKSINMHFVFWILLASMAVWALAYKRRDLTDPDDVADRVAWRVWVPVAVGAFLLILMMACVVNGEETMHSANTRFPLWSWRDGPPPGR
jgi:hypothetical protein